MPSSQNRRLSSSSSQTSVLDSTDPAPLAVYFAQFEAVGFTFAPDKGAHHNFKHLCKKLEWDAAERKDAREDFKDALVQEFNLIYGTDGNDVKAWQNLCSVIHIDPIPDDIDGCRRLVWDAYVNIVDLVDTVKTGEPVHVFNSLEELKAYTKRKKKFFPKENAYQGGLLKELLREIFNPYFGNRRNGSQKRKLRKARKRAQAGN